MMRASASVILFLVTLAGSAPALAQEALAPTVDRCIRDNAAKIEQAVASLDEAVTFLVNNLCAQPIAEESARKSKLATEERLNQLQAACDKEKAQPKDASSAARPALDACEMSNATHIGFVGIDEYSANIGVVGPPAAVTLASRLLLDLRLSHSKPGQPR